jgi:CheY-like chemotaxis protein
MTGLTNFLAPYAHLLYANRNFAIVVLCGLLAWTTGNLFISRWRQQRLQQDLADAKSSPSASSGRTYSTSSRRQMEEPPEESGGLPPVKGGRTYARNLGTALQKAGATGPQIYSPPPPPGWVTSANAGQSPAMTPPAPAPYATPNTPWAQPQAPPAAPWGFPAGAGRPMAPGPQPPPAPFYQPPPASPSVPTGAPGLFGPAGAPGYGSTPMAPVTNAAPVGAPTPVSPGFPGGPSMPPTFGMPGPGMGIPGPPEDPTQRGKPKRRRFNFNVLENLEKMVAPKAPEQATTDSVAAPAPPAPVATPSTPSYTATPPLVPIVPSVPAPTRSAPPESPRVPALTPPVESLPLSFGRPAETKPWLEPVQKAEPEPEAEPDTHEALAVEPVEAEPEPIADEHERVATEPELPVFGSTAAAEPEVAEAKPEPEPAPEHEPEPKRSGRSSMRSMLFGHEDLSPTTSEPEPEQAASAAPEEEPEASPSFRSRWAHDEDFLKALDETPTPVEETTSAESTSEDVASAPIVETPPTDEHVGEEPAEAVAETPVESAAQAPEEAPAETPTESISEPLPMSLDEGPVDEVPEPPATDGHGKQSAGTLLIIEDDKTAASYYETLFKGNGYRVEVANDGVSGVDLATRVQPDVILLDVMMPRQNGILVLQTLRASDETKNTPVVVMSNFSEPTLIKRALQLGALEYVIKTQVEGPALITAVPRWMNREKAFAAAA